MAESRKIADQAVDGIVLAGAYLLAYMLPVLVYPADGNYVWSDIWQALPLAGVLGFCILVNLRNALTGSRLRLDDLVAKVIAPTVIFVGSAVLHLG